MSQEMIDAERSTYEFYIWCLEQACYPENILRIKRNIDAIVSRSEGRLPRL